MYSSESLDSSTGSESESDFEENPALRARV